MLAKWAFFLHGWGGAAPEPEPEPEVAVAEVDGSATSVDAGSLIHRDVQWGFDEAPRLLWSAVGFTTTTTFNARARITRAPWKAEIEEDMVAVLDLLWR